jgi:hypothetical protein
VTTLNETAVIQAQNLVCLVPGVSLLTVANLNVQTNNVVAQQNLNIILGKVKRIKRNYFKK